MSKEETQELLKIIDDLIENNKHLLIQYPDNLSLQLGLENLEKQKQELESQL